MRSLTTHRDCAGNECSQATFLWLERALFNIHAAVEYDVEHDAWYGMVWYDAGGSSSRRTTSTYSSKFPFGGGGGGGGNGVGAGVCVCVWRGRDGRDSPLGSAGWFSFRCLRNTHDATLTIICGWGFLSTGLTTAPGSRPCSSKSTCTTTRTGAGQQKDRLLSSTRVRLQCLQRLSYLSNTRLASVQHLSYLSTPC